MERLYCGNKNPLPTGYTGYDTRLNCLRRGVGVGLYRLRQQNNLPCPRPKKKTWQDVPWYMWTILVLLGVTVIVFMILYWTR